MLRELLAAYIEGVEGICAVGAMLEEIFFGFGLLLHGFVLAEAVATALHSGTLDGEDEVEGGRLEEFAESGDVDIGHREELRVKRDERCANGALIEWSCECVVVEQEGVLGGGDGAAVKRGEVGEWADGIPLLLCFTDDFVRKFWYHKTRK